MIADQQPLFDSNIEMSGEFGRDWTPVSLNGPWSEVFGWSLEELLQTPFYKLIHAEDLQKTVELGAYTFTTPHPISIENRIRCKNGHYREILWDIFVTPGTDKVLVYIRDITKLKVERFLAQKSQQVAHIGSWSLDYSDLQVCWTEETYRIFGVHPDTFTPDFKNVFSFYSPEDVEELRLYYNTLPESARESDREIQIFKPNGETAFIRLTARVLKNNGVNVYLFGTVQDISAEREVKRRLVQAKEEAELASKIKTDFLANISHEIRTPMNSIIGMVDILSETSLTEEQRQYADVLSRASENLLRILNDVLDLAKLEANQLRFENIAFNVHDVIYRSVELVKHRIENKKLNLEVNIEPSVNTIIYGDPARIEQVFNNLLANAVKFTEQGTIQIHAHKSNQPQFIAFKVIDTGIGIPPESIPHLFRRFYQVDSSISRRYGGTGLGLSICKEIIERMGGKIEVNSVEGQGSSFNVLIPLSVR
ncbi:PAS domain-containing sensor histidine kinase [Bdellovibrio svalbardensis]|uniref:histidine kinase n=1 Tax=Bdellovibrio svalbardensis TaxID=2972972 RepID=A0ABT6DLM1_9BACT|nr:ATP-binding protein [Bdellovibrio svalbardensis]MDG0817781.1 ATP-binding protein [Bdellovibrio svalbardensis]